MHQAWYLPILFLPPLQGRCYPYITYVGNEAQRERLSNLLQVPPPERGGARSKAQVYLTAGPPIFSVLLAAMPVVTRCNVDNWDPDPNGDKSQLQNVTDG